MSKSTVKVVEIDTNPAVKSIKDLRKELKDFKDQMANLEEGSDAFLEIANKAGETKHQIDEINESVKGASADFGDMVGNVTNVAAGITGAFQAVAGGLQAMGVESEAIDKTIAKMQGLMAITQGLGSIDTAIKSLDKLRNSITSTTAAAKLMKAALQPKVFLAITAVTTGLSAAVGKLFSNATKLADAEKARAEAYREMKLQEQIRKQEEYNTALKRELDIKEAIIIATYAGNDVETQQALLNLYKEQRKELEAQLKNRYRDNEKIDLSVKIRQAEKELEKYTEADQEYWDLLIDKIIPWKYDLEHIKPLTDDEIKDLEKRIEEYDKLIGETQFQLDKALAIEEVLKKKREDDETEDDEPTIPTTPDEEKTDLGLVEFTDEDFKEGLDRVRQYYEELYDIQLEQNTRREKDDEGKEWTEKKRLAKEIEIEKKRLKLYEEGSLEYEKQLTKIWELENELNEIVKETTQSVIDRNEQIEKLGNEIFDNLKSSMEIFSESSLGLTDGWIKSLDEFQLAFQQTMKIVKTDGEKSWTAYGDVAATALSGIGSILNSLSNEQDASNEEGFEQMKKLQIAATIMNMLSGIMSAWTSAMNPANAWMTIWGQVATGAAMSGMIAGIGAAQIEKIKNATMSSANPNTNINAKSVNSMIMPPVQYSNAVQGANTVGAITNQKVYVTETDLVDTIGRVKVQETENTY